MVDREEDIGHPVRVQVKVADQRGHLSRQRRGVWQGQGGSERSVQCGDELRIPLRLLVQEVELLLSVELGRPRAHHHRLHQLGLPNVQRLQQILGQRLLDKARGDDAFGLGGCTEGRWVSVWE